MEDYHDTNVHDVATTFNEQGLKYKVGLFARDSNLITSHYFNNPKSLRCKYLKKCIHEDKLLFDERDIVNSLQMFCDTCENKKFRNIDDFVEHIDETYLLSFRKQLIMRTHQKMTVQRFENDVDRNEKKCSVSHINLGVVKVLQY